MVARIAEVQDGLLLTAGAHPMVQDMTPGGRSEPAALDGPPAGNDSDVGERVRALIDMLSQQLYNYVAQARWGGGGMHWWGEQVRRASGVLRTAKGRTMLVCCSSTEASIHSLSSHSSLPPTSRDCLSATSFWWPPSFACASCRSRAS